jgi:uncharacterized RDD family membrane protein YckC
MRSKTPSPGETAAPAEFRHSRGTRAAQAAARVAARYANVPSYNEMLTREARAAVDAAKAASKAAQQAQAAFQYVLDGLEAVNSAETDWQSGQISERRAAPTIVPPPQKLPARPLIHNDSAIAPSWELDTDAQPDKTATYEARHLYDRPAIMEAHPGEPGEFVQPIYANLIEFPREMIATRRVRPRRAEGPLADAESAPQLSIFEVDPSAISTQPAPATMDLPATPEWMRTGWSEMTLQPLHPSTNPPFTNFDALPPALNVQAQPSSMDLTAQLPTQLPTQNVTFDRAAQPWQQLVDELLEEPEPSPAPAIRPAPLNRRLLATFVDCTLIAGALVAAATLAAFNVSELPGLRAVALCAALALLAIGVTYHMCFMTIARATPGMRYAGIELNTFSGYTTSRWQRWGRLLALLLSVLPLGLGVVWAFFDDGHLTWHDRLSKTYLRKR